MAIRGILRQYKGGQRLNWLVWIAGFFVVLGAMGFFGSAFMALGLVSLPPSYEWPSGYVNGVVETSKGVRIVPLEATGRIQIYDPEWRYVRGWQVGAEGGPFKVTASEPAGKIEVYTLRGGHHFTYGSDGGLLATTPYTEPYESLANSGRSLIVPTFPLLWPFSSPFLSIGLGIIGFLGLRLSKRRRGAGSALS